MAAASFPAPDLGLDVLEWLYRSLVGADTGYAERGPRFFRWWGHRLAQEIQVGRAIWQPAGEVFQIRSVTPILSGVSNDLDAIDLISQFNQRALLSGLRLRDDGTLVSECSIAYSAAQAGWLRPSLVAAVGLQIALAEQYADMLVDRLGGRLAGGVPPVGSRRIEPDQILEIHERLFQPTGTSAPDVEGSFQGFASLIQSRGETAEVTDGRFVMNAPVSVQDRFYQVVVSAEAAFDPRLGHGVRLHLWLPPHLCVPSGLDVAHALQRTEWSQTQNPSHGLGSWFWDEQKALLGLTIFVPSLHCEDERLFNLLMSLGKRAQVALALSAARQLTVGGG